MTKKRYTLKSFELETDGPATASVRGLAGKFPDHAGHCDVEWDREVNKWKATSDIGNVAHDDWQVAAALRCLAARFGVPL